MAAEDQKYSEMPDSSRLNSLRFRLPLLLAIILITISVIFGVYRYHMEQDKGMQQYEKVVMGILDTLEETIGSAIFRSDISMIESIIAKLNNLSDIRKVTVYNPDWRILSEVARNKRNILTPSYRYVRQMPRHAPVEGKTCEYHNDLRCLRKINFAGYHLGWLELDYRLEHLYAHKDYDLFTSITQAVVTIVLTLSILVMYLRGKMRDLAKATGFARSIPDNFGAHLDISSEESELRQLASALNQTSASLEKKVLQVRETTDDLRTRNNRITCLYNINGILCNSMYDLTAKMCQVANSIRDAMGKRKQCTVELRVTPGIADELNIQGNSGVNSVSVGHVTISLVSRGSGQSVAPGMSQEERLFLIEIAEKVSDFVSHITMDRDLRVKSSS